MSSTPRHLARSVVHQIFPPRSAGPSTSDLDEVWNRIEAMDYGIHEQLHEIRDTLRRELASLQRENDALYRQLSERSEAENDAIAASVRES
jgi:hypothetical protein